MAGGVSVELMETPEAGLRGQFRGAGSTTQEAGTGAFPKLPPTLPPVLPPAHIPVFCRGFSLPSAEARRGVGGFHNSQGLCCCRPAIQSPFNAYMECAGEQLATVGNAPGENDSFLEAHADALDPDWQEAGGQVWETPALMDKLTVAPGVAQDQGPESWLPMAHGIFASTFQV